MNQRPIRILIADDHELVRRGLRSVLNHEHDLRVVGEASTIADTVALVTSVHPQLVVLDVRLPDGSGMEACRRLVALSPALRILVLTGYAEDATVVAAVQNGAHGYILKDVRADELLHAVRTVADGGSYLDPQVLRQAMHVIRRSPPGASLRTPGFSQLSPQERLIMPLLAEGKTNKEIAADLRLSDKTVKNYLANIFDKLHVKRRTEAVAFFMRATTAGRDDLSASS